MKPSLESSSPVILAWGLVLSFYDYIIVRSAKRKQLTATIYIMIIKNRYIILQIFLK